MHGGIPPGGITSGWNYVRGALLTRGIMPVSKVPAVTVSASTVMTIVVVNPLKGRGVNWLHYAIQI